MVADVLHPTGHTDHFADIAFAHFAAGTGAILVFDNHESNLTFSSIYRQNGIITPSAGIRLVFVAYTEKRHTNTL